MEKFLAELPWFLLILTCLTIGLAPFTSPHVWEKLLMLTKGQLIRPIDWFDLFLHGSPWLLLAAKGLYVLKKKN